MKSGIRTFLAAIVAILMAGCGMSQRDRHVAAMLDRAEAVMQSHPDSARAIVDSIDAAAIGSDALRARYAVDLHEAMFKNYIETPDDSLISFAADYYADRGDNASLAKARYFQGRALRNAANYPAATFAALRADEAASRAELTIWRARASELLADLCRSTYNVEQEIQFRKKSRQFYYEADSIRNSLCSLIELGDALALDGKVEEAIAVLDSAEILVNPNDTSILGYLYEIFATVYSNDDDPKAGHYLKKMTDYGRFGEFPQDLYIMACCQLHNDSLVQAQETIRSLKKFYSDSTEEDLHYLYPRYLYLSKIGRHDSAEIILRQLYDNQNRTLREIMRQSTLVSLNDYLRHKNETLDKEAKDARLAIWGAVLISIVLFIIIYAVVKKHVAKKNAVIKVNMEDICNLKTQLELSSRLIAEKVPLADSLNQLLGEHIALMEPYNTKDGELKENETLPIMKDILKKMSSQEYLDRLVAIVDASTSGFIGRVREKFPKIKSVDIYILAFDKAGFPTSVAARLLGLSVTNLYTRKSRIKDKIAEVK